MPSTTLRTPRRLNVADDDVEGAELLRRAELLLDAFDLGTTDEKSSVQLVRELSVHQVELALQREELARSRIELSKALARYVDLYDFAPAGYVTMSSDGSMLTLNLAAARLLGVERARLTGRGLHDFVADHDRARFDEYWRVATEERDEHSDEFDLVEASGEFTTVAMHIGRPVDPGVWRVALLDVSELHEARRAAADRLDLARSEDLGRQLHDSIRQRLFGVTALLDSLCHDQDTTDLMRRGLERAQTEVTDIIADIREIIFGEVIH
jgi:PAS domain S-box-containing protein